ncbi:MAG: 1-acyl-sn-glycerol-3-phosphate acyltransferase [Alphaproteobacteria bacterium]|nr:1-acyl-sn-glycerol-3-phosphate acyltransferase [Alphaproteobacteria bacterium]
MDPLQPPTAPPPAPHDEGAWARRALTLPAVAILATGLWSLLPTLVLVALAIDLTVGRRLSALRTLGLCVAYVYADLFGLLAAGALWAGERTGLLTPEAVLAGHRRILRTWVRFLWAVGSRLFAIRLDVEGRDQVAPGPLLVLERHASLADAVLGTLLVEVPHAVALRYAVKAELLWEPAFDVIGHRLGVAFVHRDARDRQAERARIATLARDLQPDEGVLIYPEGTRFTEAKRAKRIAEAQARRDAAAEARARAFTHVLAPHPGGVLALLDDLPGVDVLVVAHAGLEAGVHLLDLVRGSLVGTRVRVRMWRVPAADIPADRDARIAWLEALWREVDAFVAGVSPEA